jgi:signal transduction histidine kinase
MNLVYDEGYLSLQVKDDGRGFDPEAARVTHDRQWGLEGMRQRAKQLGAEFVLTSQPGQGTVISISMLLPSKEGLTQADVELHS